MPKKVLTLALTALWACPCGAQADEPAKSPDAATAGSAQLMQLCKIDIKGDKKDQWMRLPKAEASVTQHRIIAAGGKPIDYTATAGTMIIRDDEDKPIASIGYVAYTRRDAKAGSRPITFAFNGGPGSSSLWLHMGVLGPRRVVVADPQPTPAAPYRTSTMRLACWTRATCDYDRVAPALTMRSVTTGTTNLVRRSGHRLGSAASSPST